MFNCTYILTNCVFILITDQLLKTHKERLFFYLSKNTADTLHDPSGVTALFILSTWHNLIGKEEWRVKISKKTRNSFLTTGHEKEITVLLFLLFLLNYRSLPHYVSKMHKIKEFTFPHNPHLIISKYEATFSNYSATDKTQNTFTYCLFLN